MPTEKSVQKKTIVYLEHSELAEILIKQQGLHEGLFELSFEFQMHIGSLMQQNQTPYPGASFMIKKVGLVTAEKKAPHVVDAALVNPKKIKEKKS